MITSKRPHAYSPLATTPRKALHTGLKSARSSPAQLNVHRLTCPNLLMTYGATLDNSGALQWAARCGRTDLVRYYLQSGAKIDEVPFDDYIPFQWRGVPSELMARLGYREGPWHMGTALHEAVMEGHLETIKYLLDRGADPYIRDRHGRTAFEVGKMKDDSPCEETERLVNSADGRMFRARW